MNYELLQDLLLFFKNTPTCWHAASEIGIRLAQQDFTPLEEGNHWMVKPSTSYFVQRGGSLCAFTLPEKPPKKAKILASHTDSPSLKLKPHPVFIEDHMLMMRVETYGSPIINTWLNRDLVIAGRLLTESRTGRIKERLVYLDQMPVLIPSVAIHLDHKQNETSKLMSKQNHLCPILGIERNKKDPDILFRELLKREINEPLLSFDLHLVPFEPPRLIGKDNELLTSHRIDNLISVHASLLALLAAKKPQKETIQMAIFWNHEEIGSHTEEGASSPFFLDILKRITLSYKQDEEQFIQLKSRSQFTSIDMAHAYHPSYKDKYDKNNSPYLGEGIVIKHNANQRYATQGLTSAHLIKVCQKENIPYQSFASHSDLPCGSTVGALTATRTGIPAVDIGLAQLSMHAAREIVAIKDHHTLCKLLKSLLEA